MRYSFLLLSLLGVLNTRAQEPIETLKSILTSFTQPGDLYYEMQLYYYEPGQVTPADSLRGLYHRRGQSEFLQLGPVEALLQSGLYVSADHEEQLLSVLRPGKGKLHQPFDPAQLDALVNAGMLRVENAFAPPPLKALQVRDPDDVYDYRIVYDPLRNTVKAIDIKGPGVDQSEGHENEIVHVTIEYTRFGPEKLRPFPYRTQQYLAKKGKTFTPAGKCKGYRLI